jgi:hypothetical protein
MGQKINYREAIGVYFRRLWLAVCGRDAVTEDLESLKISLQHAEEDMTKLEKMYAICLEQIETDAKERRGLERLVENFRTRLYEKDGQMERMKKDYQMRIVRYTKEIDELKKQGDNE